MTASCYKVWEYLSGFICVCMHVCNCTYVRECTCIVYCEPMCACMCTHVLCVSMHVFMCVCIYV